MATAGGLSLLLAVTVTDIVYPLPLWLNLAVFTTVPIVLGSLRSRKLSPFHDEPSDEDGVEVSVIDSKEAMKFPVVASCVLVSLYAAIKYIDPKLVNLLISCYIVCIGAYCVKHFLYLFLKSKALFNYPWKYSRTVRIPYFMPVAEQLDINVQDIVSYFLAYSLAGVYFYTKNWVICNVFGISLAIHALEHMPIKNFKIIFGLLGALLCYDVFFVFGTDVMLTVAKNIEGPIKLLFPKPTEGFSMIGLGDIIMPGILVAMTIRYDMYRMHKKEKKGNYTYFICSIIGYVIGIIITICAMAIMEKEQPALLYLVPSTIISVLATAVVTGEISQIWLYEEENFEEKN
jgi:minor histocompatibility antigen H13